MRPTWCQVRRRRSRMVVLDPHTGAVLALVGGRDYGLSQLNHAVVEAPHRVDLQTLRLCGSHEHGS